MLFERGDRFLKRVACDKIECAANRRCSVTANPLRLNKVARRSPCESLLSRNALARSVATS
jgi:hypothetical protein